MNPPDLLVFLGAAGGSLLLLGLGWHRIFTRLLEWPFP